MATEPKEEGPRGFSVILAQLQDGALHGELGAELQKLVAHLGEQSNRFQRPSKGALTLTLNVVAVGSTVEVTGDVKVKTPKVPRERSVFYRTPGGNLTLDNPKQQKLALKEVPATGTKAKDVNNDSGTVRGV